MAEELTTEQAKVELEKLSVDESFTQALHDSGHPGHHTAVQRRASLYEKAFPGGQAASPASPLAANEVARARAEIARLNKDRKFFEALMNKDHPNHQEAVTRRQELYSIACREPVEGGQPTGDQGDEEEAEDNTGRAELPESLQQTIRACGGDDRHIVAAEVWAELLDDDPEVQELSAEVLAYMLDKLKRRNGKTR